MSFLMIFNEIIFVVLLDLLVDNVDIICFSG